MDKIKAQIKNYQPFNAQEMADKKIFLDWLDCGQDILTRDNEVAHLTVSAWVVSPDKRYVLMAHHNIYDSWSWLGGHVDGNKNLLDVALKEAREESGIKNVSTLQEDIFSLEILSVDGHEKRGKYVPSHLHLNVTYLLEGDMKEPLMKKSDENSGVAWIKMNEIAKKSSEPWFVDRIYTKLIKKVSCLYR